MKFKSTKQRKKVMSILNPSSSSDKFHNRMKKTREKKEEIKTPYSDTVRFYADKKNKKMITAEKTYWGKGWYEIRVGDETIKKRTNSPDYEMENLLREKYPNYNEKASLFSEMSYHSSYTQGKSNKIDNYGTSDYTLDYSSYEPIETYELEQPVLTTSKKDFGEKRNKVTTQKWKYVVLDKRPNEEKYTLRHTESTPFESEKKEIYKKTYSDKSEAIKGFNEYVKRGI
jgi:hypothetical protein